MGSDRVGGFYMYCSQLGVQTSCGQPVSIKKTILVSCVALQIAHLSRPYSTFWRATFQILTKSLRQG